MSKDAETAVARKLKTLAKRNRDHARRVANMTAEERDAYESWKATHKPTSTADRARRRQEQKSAAWLRHAMRNVDHPTDDPEVAALRALVVELEAKLAKINAQSATQQDIGVFA